MRALLFCSITLPITLLLLQSSSCITDDGSPDLLPKAPDHMLRNFLASEDSEPGAQSFNCITSFTPLPPSISHTRLRRRRTRVLSHRRRIFSEQRFVIVPPSQSVCHSSEIESRDYCCRCLFVHPCRGIRGRELHRPVDFGAKTVPRFRLLHVLQRTHHVAFAPSCAFSCGRLLYHQVGDTSTLVAFAAHGVAAARVR